MLKIIVLLGTLSGGFCTNLTQYSQKDYTIKTERFELIEFNEDYLANVVIKSFKYNRTHFAGNFSGTWKVDIHGLLLTSVQGYKFSSNEYRLFAFFFTYDVCDVLKRNIFGFQNAYDCGNMFQCPIKKGHYSACNWAPDSTQFPPHAPRGRYRFDAVWRTSGVSLLKFNWYADVQDAPVPY